MAKARTGKITLKQKDSGKLIEITVNQEQCISPSDFVLKHNLGPDAPVYLCEAQTVNIGITSTLFGEKFPYTATVTEGGSFASVKVTSTGIAVTLAKNPGGARTFQIKVKQEGGKTLTIVADQDVCPAATYDFSANPTTVNLTCDGLGPNELPVDVVITSKSSDNPSVTHPFVIESKPAWLSASIAGQQVSISATKNV